MGGELCWAAPHQRVLGALVKFSIISITSRCSLFALKAFQVHLECKHVIVMIDNTTAVTTLAHMGTSHSVSPPNEELVH